MKYPPTPADARGSAPGNNDRSARTQWVKAVAEGWFQMLLGGWKAFGRLLVEAFWEAGYWEVG